MRFLITGAAGFIGSHLSDRFVAAGHDVVGIDNFLTGSPTNVSDAVELHEFDICDRTELYRLANELPPDVVVHCAASYSDPNLWHRDIDTNIAGTINATLVAKHQGARLVYFQTALPPISSYAISKIAGEQYIALSNVPSLVFRLSNIYGPRNLSGPVPTFFKRLSAGEACTVTDTKRDMVYVKDLIDLVTLAIDEGASGKYDVCSGIHRPIADLFRAVAMSLDSEDIPHLVDAPPDDVKQMDLNPSRALTDFGWAPIWSLGGGVQTAVDWYREHGVGETYTHLTLKG